MKSKLTAHMIITCILNIASFALCIDQFYVDWAFVNGDLVFKNFSSVDKLVSCFKLYITGYNALHTKGSEMFGFVCLMGCSLHWFGTAYHHVRGYENWIRTRVLCIIFVSVAGVYLLCCGMVIPADSVWHAYVVPTITIVIVLIDGVLLIGDQIKKSGGSEKPLRDMAIKLVETTISIIRLVYLKGQTHKPWNTEEILHLVGGGMSVLIGICLIGFMVCNAGIPSKVVEFPRKMARVFAVDEDGDTEDPRPEGGGGDIELVVLEILE